MMFIFSKLVGQNLLKLDFTAESFWEFSKFFIGSPQITFEQLHLVVVGIARAQPAFTCSMLTIETLEQGVKYVQHQR